MASELSHVLKLLDDPNPTVQKAVEGFVQQYQGDMSQALAEEQVTLTTSEKNTLTQYTYAGRRDQILQNWQVPTRFQDPYSNDWETFEYLLSLISDLLHDGITPRLRMIDSIDALADEITVANAGATPDTLANFLFKTSRFTGNKTHYFAQQNSDLAWVIESSIGNPISLCILYMLLGNRFGLDIYGCNYPGHFLAWVNSSPKSYLIDTYNRARILHPDEIISKNPNISQNALVSLQAPCAFATIIQRVLNNLESSYSKDGLTQETNFLHQLKQSLVPAQKTS